MGKPGQVFGNVGDVPSGISTTPNAPGPHCSFGSNTTQ